MSNSVFPPRYVRFPENKHDTTVIYLHDRDSTGVELAEQIGKSSTVQGETLYQHFPNTRWVFPSARAKHFYWTQKDRQQLSENDKDSTTEWFELASLADVRPVSSHQFTTLRESASYILRIIDDELERVDKDPRRIFLAGIGQGAALGLVVMLCVHHQLGGFVGLNGWMPFTEHLSRLVEQDRAEDAGGFFKSSFIVAAQQTYIQQRQQRSMRNETPPSLSQSTANATLPKVVVPDYMKGIPIILSYCKEGAQLAKPELGIQALKLMTEIGFSNTCWKPELGGQTSENVVRDAFSSMSKELKDVISFFEDLRLSNNEN